MKNYQKGKSWSIRLPKNVHDFKIQFFCGGNPLKARNKSTTTRAEIACLETLNWKKICILKKYCIAKYISNFKLVNN